MISMLDQNNLVDKCEFVVLFILQMNGLFFVFVQVDKFCYIVFTFEFAFDSSLWNFNLEKLESPTILALIMCSSHVGIKIYMESRISILDQNSLVSCLSIHFAYQWTIFNFYLFEWINSTNFSLCLFEWISFSIFSLCLSKWISFSIFSFYLSKFYNFQFLSIWVDKFCSFQLLLIWMDKFYNFEISIYLSG
jgi:hypothetical protein